MPKLVTLAAAAAMACAVSAQARADFAFTDLTRADISRFSAPKWQAKAEANRVTVLCTDCPGVSAIDIQIADDDGTGGRIRSGETTAETMAAIGRANAARNPGVSQYFGAEAVRRGSAVGFRQEAKAADRYFISYMLYDGGKRLIMRGVSPDREVARDLAKRAYDTVGAQMAR
jgi:hypothetical protein